MIFSFRITQKDHSTGILKDIQKFLGCGKLTVSKRDKTVEFFVKNFEDILLKIIPHFEAHPLVTSKQLNFESFKEAALLVKSGAHLTKEGLNKIKELKANMNTGRSFEDKFRHCWAKCPIILQPEWIIGFIDGCFFNKLSRRQKSGYSYIETESSLRISQNIHDVAVLLAIKNYFSGSGYLDPKLEDYSDLDAVRGLSRGNVEYYNSKTSSFIPFLDKFTLLTRKQLDYLDFKKFLALKEAKAYRTEEGLKEMENIIINMNTGRSGKSRRKSV